jgi:predicted HTH transcriptional regulator
LEEALINAFFHRDYTKASPIWVLLFKNRLEIISPGSLPYHLNVDNITFGDTMIRNNRIVSFGSKILPHRGLGSGIRRIVKEHPKTEFINDIDGQQFKVITHRKS